MAVIEVVWIEQFAEIAGAHLERRNSEGVRIGKDVAHPFLSPVPENLGLVLIEVAGDIKRTANVVAKLVVVNRSGDAGGCRNSIALPRIGIEDGVANVFIGGAMEFPGAGLGKDANLAAGG